MVLITFCPDLEPRYCWYLLPKLLGLQSWATSRVFFLWPGKFIGSLYYNFNWTLKLWCSFPYLDCFTICIDSGRGPRRHPGDHMARLSKSWHWWGLLW
jgi:hypothetical protein